MVTPRPDPSCAWRSAGPDEDRPGAPDTPNWTRSTDRHKRAIAPRGSANAGLSLKGRALALLARREHSRAELSRKLAVHAESAEALDRVLDELAARGFVSDARVVESVIHQRASRHGADRIRAELARKGIDAQLAAPALDALREDEYSRAAALWRERFGKAQSVDADEASTRASPTVEPEEPPALTAAARREADRARQVQDTRERARQQRFLLSRGFSAAVVSRVLRHVQAAENHEDGDIGDGADSDADRSFSI